MAAELDYGPDSFPGIPPVALLKVDPQEMEDWYMVMGKMVRAQARRGEINRSEVTAYLQRSHVLTELWTEAFAERRIPAAIGDPEKIADFLAAQPFIPEELIEAGVWHPNIEIVKATVTGASDQLTVEDAVILLARQDTQGVVNSLQGILTKSNVDRLQGMAKELRCSVALATEGKSPLAILQWSLISGVTPQN